MVAVPSQVTANKRRVVWEEASAELSGSLENSSQAYTEELRVGAWNKSSPGSWKADYRGRERILGDQSDVKISNAALSAIFTQQLGPTLCLCSKSRPQHTKMQPDTKCTGNGLKMRLYGMNPEGLVSEEQGRPSSFWQR